MFRAIARQCSKDGHAPVSFTKQKKVIERRLKADPEVTHLLTQKKIGKPVTQADRRRVWFELQNKQYAPVFLNQLKPRMTLWTTALKEEELPPPRLPEIALAGRSNCGKSTLTNYLSGRAHADVRRIPGSTRELTFWKLGTPNTLCVVDLPGYGYAVAPKETRHQWTEFTLWYLQRRKNLRLVVVLVDARHGLMVSDREFMHFLERHNVPYQIVLSKCDQVRPRELARRITAIKQNELGEFTKMVGPPIPISSLKKQNLDALRKVLHNYAAPKQVVVDGIKKKVYDLLELRRINRAERRKRKKTEDEEPMDGDGAISSALNSWGVGVFQGGFWTCDDRDSRRVEEFISLMWGQDAPESKTSPVITDVLLDEDIIEPPRKTDVFADVPFFTSFDFSDTPEEPEVIPTEETQGAFPKLDSDAPIAIKKGADTIVEEDDLVSEEERLSGFRRGKPFDPSARLHDGAKFVYERKQRTALDEFDDGKQEEVAPEKKAYRPAPPLPLGRRSLGEPVPKGIRKWKVLGRPKLKVPRVKYKPDAATLIGARGESRNKPKSWDWAGAQKKWIQWARQQRKAGRSHVVPHFKAKSRADVDERFRNRISKESE